MAIFNSYVKLPEGICFKLDLKCSMYIISSTNSASFVAADIFQTPFMLRHSARPALWCRSFPNPRKAFRCCLKTCQRTRGVDVFNAMDDGFWGAYQRFAYDCDNSMNCTNYMDIHKKLELDLKQAVKKFHVFYSLAAIFMIACQLAWRPSQPRNQDSSYQTGKSLCYVKSGMDSSWLRNNHWIHLLKSGPTSIWGPKTAHFDAIGNLKPDIFQDCTFLEVAQWHEATLGPSATPLALELHHDPRRRRSSVVCKYAKEAQAEARSEGTGRNWKELEHDGNPKWFSWAVWTRILSLSFLDDILLFHDFERSTIEVPMHCCKL